MPKIVKGGDRGRDVVVRLGEVLSSRCRQLGDMALNAGAGTWTRIGRSRRLVSVASSSGRQASSRSRIAARKPAVQSRGRTTPSSVAPAGVTRADPRNDLPALRLAFRRRAILAGAPSNSGPEVIWARRFTRPLISVNFVPGRRRAPGP